MTTRVIINGREIKNPIIKAVLAFGFILIASLISLVVIFVLLPVAGIVITLSVGFVVVFIAAIIAGFVALILTTVVFGRFFGSTDFKIEKINKRK